MKKLTQTFSLILVMVMLITNIPVIPVQAENGTNETEATYMFGDADKAYATDILYVNEIGEENGAYGLYVIGGKGFYTSPDGVTWTARATGAGMEALQVETYGFAYGGPADNRYFMVIPDTTSANKVLIMNQTMTAMTEVYTYSNVIADGSNEAISTPVYVKGTIMWDEFTQKFWCGATLADGTKAGLYYSDGTYTLNETTSQLEMLWTKADTGERAIIAENFQYPDGVQATEMKTVLANITSDGKGHLVAVGVWGNRVSGNQDTYAKMLTGAGSLTCQTALLVNAESSDIEAKIYDFSKFCTTLSLSTAVINDKSHVIFQHVDTTLMFRYTTFADIWKNENNTQLTGQNGIINTGSGTTMKYALDSVQQAKWQGQLNTTNVLSDIVCLDAMMLLLPRSGHGISSGNVLSDIYAVTYQSNGKLQSRYLPFINNTATVKEIMGSFVKGDGTTGGTRKYIAGAAAGPDGKVVIVNGKSKKTIATEQDFATTIAIIDTKDTITNSKLTEAEIAAYTPVDRSDKVICTTSPTVLAESTSKLVAVTPPVEDNDDKEQEDNFITTPGKLNPTGENTKAWDEWLATYQADILVEAMLKNNIAFVHNSNRIWVKDKVEETDSTIPNATYISDKKIFMLPVKKVNEYFNISASGNEEGLISSEEVKTLTGKTVFIDPRGFILFSDGNVVDTSVPTGYSGYRDYYTVADAIGYITWEDREFTEQARLDYLKKWREALSIPEDVDRDANNTYITSVIAKAQTELEKITYTVDNGTYTVTGFTGYKLEGYDLTVQTSLQTFKNNLYNSYKSLQSIAIGYNCMTDKTSTEAQEMKNVIFAGMKYLLKYYKMGWDMKLDGTSNWTLTQFSLPIVCSNLLCLMYDEMEATDELKQLRTETCNQIFDKSPVPNLRSGGKQNGSETYTNRLWRCFSYYNAAVIANDSYRMNYALKYATPAFLYSPHNTGFEELSYNRDGFYIDGSMVFHASIPYNMGYGVSYSVLIYEFLELTKDTDFYITNIYGFENVYDFCLNNFIPFLTNGMTYKMTVGRNTVLSDVAILRNIAYISNHAPEEKRIELTAKIKEILNGRSISSGSIQYIINNPMLASMKNNFESYASNISASTPNVESTVYYNQDQIIHKRDAFTATLSMSSTRISKYESYKTNNPNGWYLGDGMLYVYTDNKQYNDLYFSNTDGYYMPGTTVDSTQRQAIHTETETGNGTWGLPDNDWAGGVTDGTNTVAGYQIGNKWVSTLTGKKSYFMFGDKIICLGSNITGGTGNTYTVLENRIIDKEKDGTSNELTYKVNEVSVTEEEFKDTIYNVVDGSGNTNCALRYKESEIVFDFGKKVDIGLVGMSFTYGNTRKELATMQVSDDGVTFTTIGGENVKDGVFKANGKVTKMEYYSFDNCSGRYFKIISKGNEQNKSGNIADRFALNEIEFYKSGITKEQIAESKENITKGFDDLVIDGTLQEVTFNTIDTKENPDWLWLEKQEGFVFLDDAALKMERESSGSLVYMKMYVEHGENPTDAGYAYVQLPLTTKEETELFANSDVITVIQNDAKAHAIYDHESGLIGANIFEAGVTIEGITFNTLCAALIDMKNGKMYISEPTWKNAQVSLTLPDTMTNVAGEDIVTTATRNVSNDILVDVSVKRGSSHEITFSLTENYQETHIWAQQWSSDETYHWHECSCGATKDYTAHTFKWIVDQEAVGTVPGSKHEECEICGYARTTVEIPAPDIIPIPTPDTTSTPTPSETPAPDNTEEADDDNGQTDDKFNEQETQTTSSAQNINKTPETGDNSSLVLWFIMSGLALATVLVLLDIRRKKEN